MANKQAAFASSFQTKINFALAQTGVKKPMYWDTKKFCSE